MDEINELNSSFLFEPLSSVISQCSKCCLLLVNILNFAKQVFLFRPLIMNADPFKNVYSSDIQHFKVIQIIYKLVSFSSS